MYAYPSVQHEQTQPGNAVGQQVLFALWITVRSGRLFAFVDSLAKTLLTCVPEPPPDSYNQAVARGKARYDRFLKSVGMGMAGDSQAALTELLRRVKEE